MKACRSYPQGVEATKLETYLSVTDFQSAFSVSISEFDAMPQWKRTQKKKDLKLF